MQRNNETSFHPIVPNGPEEEFYQSYFQQLQNSWQALKRIFPGRWEFFLHSTQKEKIRAWGLDYKRPVRRPKTSEDKYKITSTGPVEIDKYTPQYPAEEKQDFGPKLPWTAAKALGNQTYTPPIISLDQETKDDPNYINSGIVYFLKDYGKDANMLLGEKYAQDVNSYEREKRYAATEQEAKKIYNQTKSLIVEHFKDLNQYNGKPTSHNEFMGRGKHDKYLSPTCSFADNLASKIETQLHLADLKIEDDESFTEFVPTIFYQNVTKPYFKPYYFNEQLKDLNLALNSKHPTILVKAMFINWFKEDFKDHFGFLRKIESNNLKEEFKHLLTEGNFSELTLIKILEKILNRPINFKELNLTTKEERIKFIDNLKDKISQAPASLSLWLTIW